MTPICASNPDLRQELAPATVADLARDLRALGLQRGQLLNAKISMRSLGPVAGGTEALLEALLEVLGPEGTLVSEAFVRSYPLPLSEEHQRLVVDQKTPSFAGAFANTMIHHPRAFRSRHPIMKFVAIGAQAEVLMREHTAASGAYNVLGRMLKQGGINLKLGSEDKVPGVGTTHVALCDLGFRQRPMKLGVMHRDEDGQVRLFVRNWVGGCGRGFPRLAFLYKERGAVLAEGKVALAPAKLTDMRKTYDIEMEVIRKNPRAILCLNPDCRNCRTDWEFSDTWLWVFRARRLFRRIFHPSSQAREHP